MPVECNISAASRPVRAAAWRILHIRRGLCVVVRQVKAMREASDGRTARYRLSRFFHIHTNQSQRGEDRGIYTLMDCYKRICPCGRDSVDGKLSLKKIVDAYIKSDSGNLKNWLQQFDSIIDCICGDVVNTIPPKNGKFKKNSHQYRLKNKSIIEFNNVLEDPKEGIAKKTFSSFDDLFRYVNAINVEGIGALAKYDFCLRYGFSRGLTPQVVYVHAGTGNGARALKNHGYIKKVKDEMPVSEFPAELHKLEPMHIENLLCIYDDLLAKLPNK